MLKKWFFSMVFFATASVSAGAVDTLDVATAFPFQAFLKGGAFADAGGGLLVARDSSL